MNNENKLDPEFKAKWVAALRSGEYRQGKGWLHNNGTYCCLGVACKVVGIPNSDLRSCWIKSYDQTFDSVPKILRGSSGVAYTLGKMNDDYISFFQIADYIEANL